MKYLHTMLRVSDLEAALGFWKDQLGLIEINRIESEGGRFILVFLAAPEDETRARAEKAPLLELTYNWPGEDGGPEVLSEGRSFGHLAFVVEDIYETCSQLSSAGVTINRPPRDGHMAFIRSPVCQSIELLQRGDALPPQEPWVSMPNVGSW